MYVLVRSLLPVVVMHGMMEQSIGENVAAIGLAG